MGRNGFIPNLLPSQQVGLFRPESFVGTESFKLANKALLEKIDRQDACGMFVWHNLPEGITSELIERMLYYRYSIIAFYMKSNDRFYFLPYNNAGTPDVWGRIEYAEPMTFGGFKDEDKIWVKGLKYKVQHTPQLTFVTSNDQETKCVILRDYTQGVGAIDTPRAVLQDPLLDTMADIIPYCHTALKNSTGVKSIRINDESELQTVRDANIMMDKAALNGAGFVPLCGQVEFQELKQDSPARVEEYLMALQSLDNYRCMQHGLSNGSLMQKGSHMLQSENDMNAGVANMTFQDRYNQRIEFCKIFNSLFGLDLQVSPSESVLGMDLNGDGVALDDNSMDYPSYVSNEKETTDYGNESQV